MPRSKTRIPSGTSSRLTDMIRATTKAVEANRDTINALNVFPVPDGDTGTNMLLTLRSIVEALPTNSTESANSVSKSVARSALLGARGNSGLILAQYFKGLAEAIGDSPQHPPAIADRTHWRTFRQIDTHSVGQRVQSSS